MQEEFFKQNGMKLVLNCRMKFGDLYLSLVLEILATMTFYEEARELLKNDVNFINDLEIYIQSYDENVQKSAKTIKWKLTDSEQKNIHNNTTQYDIMISYNHKHKNIAMQLFEQLRKDGFSVWIDVEMMTGSVLEALAGAVENSKNILVCMSTEYSKSIQCRLELEYAFELHRRIIPIKVEKFRPDGWLRLILSGLLYHDFSKNDFNESYKQLYEHIKNT